MVVVTIGIVVTGSVDDVVVGTEDRDVDGPVVLDRAAERVPDGTDVHPVRSTPAAIARTTSLLPIDQSWTAFCMGADHPRQVDEESRDLRGLIKNKTSTICGRRWPTRLARESSLTGDSQSQKYPSQWDDGTERRLVQLYGERR